MQRYYALGNVVYKEGGDVLCVIAPGLMLRKVAAWMASVVAAHLNENDADSRDVLRGSLD